MLPEKLLSSLEGIEGFNKETFEKIHASGEQITSIRLNPFKYSETKFPPLGGRGAALWGGRGAVLWTECGFYLRERPSFTFDPLFHAGCYYVQEASSMFIEQALKQTVDLSKPLKILDLCAAPGGKSTHLQSLISRESLLVSNEVIKSRVNILKDNIIKWGCENVIVTNNDPKDFSRLENYFDVIVIDAPCSGSGLFRREPDAINEWSENNVKLCSLRQQRIISDVLPALRKDGILIYSTCSYSKEEDEDICEWMEKEFRIKNLELKIKNDWNIVEPSYGYRFWPDKLKGEGFFLACFKKEDGEVFSRGKIKPKHESLSKKDSAIVEHWVGKNSLQYYRRNDTVYAMPQEFIPDISMLTNNLRVVYSGVAVGEIIHDKLIPDHALAMSLILHDAIPSVELNYATAIEYLKKKELKINVKEKGWQLVKYEGQNLGWINVLSSRINNYYPKELRILKET